jgi:hypothetical protein
MATGIYLIDHPPRIRQYRSPRRAKPSGLIVVHTAEWFPDESGPDSGAENCAGFIVRRTNYGSYHHLVDSDSIIQLVRFGDEAFHDATGSNPYSYGVSAATQAAKWNTVGTKWRQATVLNMARGSARYARWVKSNYGILIPAKRVTRAESENRKPGFISHAERDPARRTDPGKLFPWTMFLNEYAREMGSKTPTVTTLPTVSLRLIREAARVDPPRASHLARYPSGTKLVERALVRDGNMSSVYADKVGHFGSVTVKAYAQWQRELGYSGADADGIPGKTSLTKLGAKHKLFTVRD